ncbi:hypothetical protein BCV70DRAFT_215683 [Testicularia cyperi]|uniref:Uncharacterized protein n=1 Tax=Testicularia cyperi TaxID=1882483 RepID=A0A317XVK7_9BASI|nr:hypothetical protein BCV70DRAFT_215683 [Testicularia cyperi]
MASPPPPPPFFQHHEAMALPAFGSLVSTPGRNTSSTSLPAESLQGSEWGYDSPARCDESDSAVWSRTGVAEATLDRAHSVMGATSGTADTSAGHHYPSFYSSELVDSPANRYTALQADAFAAWQGRSLPSGRLSVSVPRSELGVELWEGVGTMSKSAPRWLSQAADAFASSNAAHEVYGGTSSSHSFPTFGSHLMRVSTDEPMMVQTPTHLHPQLQTGRYGHSAAAATATVYDAQASASEAREQQGPVPSDSRDTLRDPFGSASPLTDFSVDPPRPGSSQGAATTSFATHGSFPSATVAPQHFGGPSPAPHQQLQHHLIRNNHGSDHASANASASGFGHSYSSSSSIDPSLMHTSFDMPHFSLPPSAAWS